EEVKRGITIKLGYADAKIYKCDSCGTYCTKETCAKGHETKFVRKVSFVDCPGHESLMAIMMSGASLMDGALLIVAANEVCPQPQTVEHLAALEISGIKNIVIVQNKIDLVSRDEAKKHYDSIKAFVKGSVAENAPIVPVAAHYNININEVVRAIEEHIKTPQRDQSKPFKMLIARSFDVNKPNTKIDVIVGGVIGGSITQGEVKKDDELEIVPGIKVKDKYVPLKTRVSTISIKEGFVKKGMPGGLIALGTLLDPALTKGDNLIGNVVGKPGTLPKTRGELTVDPHLLEKVIGVERVEPLKPNEMIVINTGTTTTVGLVSSSKKNEVKFMLKKPICVENDEKVGLSRKSATRWYLIGYGVVK
ncbi:translation initiation factor IF-2 subunit gamma, partial [Candidatus Micrarchaeota archaeon]|nr:translation initiation factor IF-2 subunit gamma [Candidatus Micrarchaeota archaeon]